MTAAAPLKAAPRTPGSKAPDLGRLPPVASQQTADRLPDRLRAELWSAAGSLQGAADVLGQLHGLFEAIRQLGGKESLQLARVGANLALEWADTLGATAERAFAQGNETKTGSAPAPLATAAGPGVLLLPLADYDTATLHLERAETLAEMLCALGSEGINRLAPGGVVGAFDGLQGELVEIREALVQGRKRGEA
jgi:hypothetical protein